jgi:hypothetical protein
MYHSFGSGYAEKQFMYVSLQTKYVIWDKRQYFIMEYQI